MSTNFFREVTISGSPTERGRMYGEKLAGEIAKTIAFYQEIFNLPDAEILGLAAKFRDIIEDFNPDYMTEINAMAEAAGLDPLWIVALNARTEILSYGGLVENPGLQAIECTSLCYPGSRVLGQTWDWGKALEELSVILHLKDQDGHVITMVTEPGIIGKIGMNNAGLGVCLNMLKMGEKLDGVPIHIMLRGLLDCRTIEEAQNLIANNASGKSSYIAVADDQGNCFGTEFAVTKTFTLEPEDGVLFHANHYLGQAINAPDDPLFGSSYARYERTAELTQDLTDKSLKSMKTILSDRANTEFPIFRSYIPYAAVKELGTVFTMAMDLSTRELHIRKGSEPEAPFRMYQVGQAS